VGLAGLAPRERAEATLFDRDRTPSKIARGEDAVIASMEERLAEVLPELEKRIGSLWSLANIATLIGLLGTISGLIKSFAAVAFAYQNGIA